MREFKFTVGAELLSASTVAFVVGFVIEALETGWNVAQWMMLIPCLASGCATHTTSVDSSMEAEPTHRFDIFAKFSNSEVAAALILGLIASGVGSLSLLHSAPRSSQTESRTS